MGLKIMTRMPTENYCSSQNKTVHCNGDHRYPSTESVAATLYSFQV